MSLTYQATLHRRVEILLTIITEPQRDSLEHVRGIEVGNEF